MAKYSEEEQALAVELAQDIGLAATRRELGYPSNWSTLKRWCDEAGVTIELDALKSKAAQFNSFYDETELRIAQQDALSRGLELLESKTLTPAEFDKIVSGLKKITDAIQMLRGKATSRVAKEDTTDDEAAKIYEQWQAEQSSDHG